jgi:hypothetical protein
MEAQTDLLNPRAQQQRSQPDTTTFDRWKANNGWYGKDQAKTQRANQIGSAGVRAGSADCFNRLDALVQQSDGQVRIPASVASWWRKMGSDADNPEVTRRMVSHRAALVEMGILPAQPVHAPVRS